MATLASCWPSDEDQAGMAQFFADFPLLAYGMCSLCGAHRHAGMTRSEAARHGRLLGDPHHGMGPGGWREGGQR